MKIRTAAILALVAICVFAFNEYTASAERKCLELGNSANQCAKLNF